MRTNDFEKYLRNVYDRVETIEFVDGHEEGVISLEDFIKELLTDYCKSASKDKVKDLKKFLKSIM